MKQSKMNPGTFLRKVPVFLPHTIIHKEVQS